MRIIIHQLYFLILFFGFINSSASGQSLHEPLYLYEECDIVEMPTFSNPSRTYAQHEGPLSFAHPFNVFLTPDNSGHWIDFADGSRIWTIAIRSEGAESLNLILDQFRIASGCHLLVYSPLESSAILEYTSSDGTPTGVLPTVPLPGDMIALEYHQPSDCHEKPQIIIGAVNHDYLGIFGKRDGQKAGKFGDSGKCNPDISCNIDEMAESQSVCRIIVDGTELCSGTLLNNTRQDGTPYFLSAAHCFKREVSDATTIFLFNYEVPWCQTTIEGNKMQYITGGTMRTFIDTLDVALLEMNRIPPLSFQPFWAGWNLEETTEWPLTVIHHPMGDVKKYAKTNNPPKRASFHSYSNSGKPFAPEAHWHVAKWDEGTTEGGSSGSGLFDASHRLIGTLSGGEASCNHPFNDYFARIKNSWNAGTTNDKRLSAWLNPDSESIQKLDGINYYQKKTERISAINVNDTPAAMRYTETNNGFIAGHNMLKHDGFAHHFSNIVQATVRGVYIVNGKNNSGAQQTFNIKLWSDNDGQPGIELGVIENIPVSLLKNRAESFFEFAVPVKITEPIHAGIEINYQEKVDSVALYVKKEQTKNHLSVRKENRWSAFNTGSNESLSLWIDLLATDVIKSDAKGPTTDQKLHVYPQKVTDNIIVVTSDENKIESITLYDLKGVPVISKNVHGQSSQINCHTLAPAVYIVRARLNNGFAERKIVKLP